MKKLLLSLIVMAGFASLQAQSQLSLITEINTSTALVANYPIWINIVKNGNLSQQLTGMTTSGGQYMATINHPGNAVITYVTYDCQGNIISSSETITPNNTWAGDTLVISCASSGAGFGCQALWRQTGSGSGLSINVQDSSNYANVTGSEVGRIWTWGDGTEDTIYGMNNFTTTHTYAQTGTYQVCMYNWQYDTLGYYLNLCNGFSCDSITVSGSNPATFCTASYWVDTVNSGGGNAFIVNNSTPANNDPAYSTSYSWDFGDGGTSSQPYPVHNYTAAGTYGVCLTITSADNNSNVCTDTYCDTLGVDAQGNLLYKNAMAGFTLTVLDPTSVGLNEEKVATASLYPNPAHDAVTVSLDNGAEGAVKWQLLDLKGATVDQGSEKLNGKSFTLKLDGKVPGVYILSVKTGNSVSHSKLTVQ